MRAPISNLKKNVRNASYGLAVVLGDREAREFDGLEVVLAAHRRVPDVAHHHGPLVVYLSHRSLLWYGDGERRCAGRGEKERRGETRRDETRRMMPATTAGCSSGSAGAGMFYSEREQTKAMACGRCLRWSPFAGRCEYGDGDGGEGCCGTSAASLTARSDALRGSKAVRRRKAVEPSVLLWLHGWVPPPVPCFEVLFFYLQLMYRTE